MWLPCVNRLFSRLLCPVLDLIPLQDLTKQLDEVTQNSEIVEIRQKEAECELEAARDRVQQQATEILLKASKTLNHPPLFSSPLTCEKASEYVHPYPQDTSWICRANTNSSSHLVLGIMVC